MDTYLKQLQDLDKIYYCIKLAMDGIVVSEGHYRAYGDYSMKKRYQHKITILRKAIKRLEERQSKITIQLYKRNVTKTQ